MFEFLLDVTNVQPDYSLYIALMLGLSVRLLWIWKIEYLYFNTFQSTSECHIQAKNLSIQMKKQPSSCNQLTWIVKYIRRKESPGDDPDHIISSISK